MSLLPLMPNTLEHLLEVESQASALVNDAEEEAQRRIRENEERNHIVYEERLKEEIEKRELLLKEEKEKIKNRYQESLDDFLKEISNINVDEKGFCDLLNKYLKG